MTKKKWIAKFLENLYLPYLDLKSEYSSWRDRPLFFKVSIRDILAYVDETKARSYLMDDKIVNDVSCQFPIFGKAPDVENLYCSFSYDRGAMVGLLCHSDVHIAFGQYVAGTLDDIGHRASDTEEFYAMCELNKK